MEKCPEGSVPGCVMLNTKIDNTVSGTTVLTNQAGGVYWVEQAAPLPRVEVVNLPVQDHITSTCTGQFCEFYNNGTLYNVTPNYHNKQEDLHMADFILFGLGCIAMAIAGLIVTGARIWWLQEVGDATYTRTPRRSAKKAKPLAD
jgi:hypothetical protein